MTWGNNGAGPLGVSPFANWPGNAGATYPPFYNNSESILAVMSRGGISANLTASNGAPLLQAIAQGIPQNAINGIGLTQAGAAVDPTRAAGVPAVNVIQSPFSFGSAPWGWTRVTVTNNSGLDPLGGNTACTILETAAAGNHVIGIGIGVPILITAGVVTLSAYFNPNLTRPGASLQINAFPAGNIFASFALVGAGSVVFSSPANGIWSAAVATITPAANGFYLCTITATVYAALAAVSVSLGICSDTAGTTSYTGIVTDGITAWNASLQLLSIQIPMQYVGS